MSSSFASIHRRWTAALMADGRSRTAEDVAQRLGIHEQAARHALSALAGLNLVTAHTVRKITVWQAIAGERRMTDHANSRGHRARRQPSTPPQPAAVWEDVT